MLAKEIPPDWKQRMRGRKSSDFKNCHPSFVEHYTKNIPTPLKTSTFPLSYGMISKKITNFFLRVEFWPKFLDVSLWDPGNFQKHVTFRIFTSTSTPKYLLHDNIFIFRNNANLLFSFNFCACNFFRKIINNSFSFSPIFTNVFSCYNMYVLVLW